MLLRDLRPVLLGLEPSFPVMPKGKDHGRERVRALGSRSLAAQMPHYRVSARLKGGKDPFPNNQRSSEQHSHCSCTSSRLKPDTNGFPGSRPQHEAIESPEVTVSVKFSGFCYANTHDQPLL